MGTDLYTNDSSRDAVVVDPGSMEEPMLKFIERHEYAVRGVLITHDHLNHVRGLRTLKRIYDVDIYALSPIVRELKTCLVKDGDSFSLGSIDIEVIAVPGHSSDSACYKIGRTLFTGDCLSAGLVGSTSNSYGSAVQMNALLSKVLSMPENYIILPGHGPPSTLDAERRFNWGINNFEQNKTRRMGFTREFD
jgi:glyoxylase-like metal-dependent hydrolase (beta-lactamase superfamily II)